MVHSRAVPTDLPDMSSLYEKYHAPIYKYVLHLIGDREQAEDLTQDTFLKAFRALPALDPTSLNLSPWIYRIATNTTYDALRRKRLISWAPLPESAHAIIATSSEGVDPGETYGTAELVRKALHMMPHKYRVALLMHERDGFSYPEIAQELSISPKGVKMLLTRARKSFRRCFLSLEQGHPHPLSHRSRQPDLLSQGEGASFHPAPHKALPV